MINPDDLAKATSMLEAMRRAEKALKDFQHVDRLTGLGNVKVVQEAKSASQVNVTTHLTSVLMLSNGEIDDAFGAAMVAFVNAHLTKRIGEMRSDLKQLGVAL